LNNSAKIHSVTISAVIIAFNEERKIADAISSVSWADEVVLVDSESTDATAQIASDLGARVIVQPWLGFSAQKQFGVDAAQYDWILSLDADERVSDELKAEILELMAAENAAAAGYRIPRLTYYMDRAIRHSGWYPDRQIRLFDRSSGRWNERLIHESVGMKPAAKIANLKGEILHFSVDSPEYHHQMIGERYAPMAAEQMRRSGTRTSRARIAVSGPAAFFRSYVLKAGFLDGFPGYCIAKFAAYHAFMKHLLLWEMQQAENADE
jgi:glycosyltransferase involved in cell wall biosynthesis